MALPDTRISLIQRLHDQQDAAAWSEFCAIYERAVYRIALKYGLQDADAREVSQEVLLAVSKRIKNFDVEGRGKFRSWLATVARNATIDLLRKNRRVTNGDSAMQQGLQQLELVDDNPELFDLESQRAQFQWAAEQIRAAVSESTWQAFWRTAVQAETAESVAKNLKISVGAVYVARCRTLAKIKALVSPFREEQE